MAVVKFVPKPWQMNDFTSVKEHIQQFYEKFEELGMIHIPKTTDPNFETLANPMPMTTIDNTTWTKYNIATKTYKFPKGDGTINYSEPDEHGISRIESFSMPDVDLYIKVTFQFTRTVYRTPNVGNRGFALNVLFELDRLGEFLPGVTYPTWDSFMYCSWWGSTGPYNGTVVVIAESVMSLTPDGLVVLHGLNHQNNNKYYMCGGPKNLVQFVLHINKDQTVGVYTTDGDYDCSSSSYDGSDVSSNNWKMCYNYINYKLNGRVDYYTRPVGFTPYPLTDVPNNVQGFIQGLPCYRLNHQNNIIESNMVFTFYRGLTSGDNQFVVWRDGKQLYRTLYIQDQNTMTPSNSGQWTGTWSSYNREYGHIIEEAPLI